MELFGGVLPITGTSFLLFCILAILFVGYALGRITIKGVSLGDAGVFIIALLFGALFYVPLADQMVLKGEAENLVYVEQALGIIEKLGLIFFVTAVALDACGNGTDDHIAYLGVKAFDSNDHGDNAYRVGEQVLMLVLYNARQHPTVATLQLGSVKSWIGQVEQYAYKSLISITAGDYDGDGIDEIACTDANMGVQTVEI